MNHNRTASHNRIAGRSVGVLALSVIIGALSVESGFAQPGEPKTKGPPPGKGPPRSPEEFFDRERAKLVEKAAREGTRFDATREMQKLNERFQKDFGEPLPDVWQKELGAAAQNSGAPVSPPASQSAISTTSHNTTLLATGGVHRGPRYAHGLPAWYQERDCDRDGQIGLYEWPRAELVKFREWDLNGDGFLAQTELLRRMRQLGIAVPQDRAKTMASNNRSAATALTAKPTTNGTPAAIPTTPSGNAAVAKPSPKAAPTPEEFAARESQKLLDKAAREGDRFDADRELQNLRDKFRKDVGEEMPGEMEAAFRNAFR